MLGKPVLLMCVPKCGTHLIMNIIYSFLGPTNMHGFDKGDKSSLVNELFLNSNELENKVYTGHFWYSKDLEVKMKDITKIILVRDPRDYVVSQAHFLHDFKKAEKSTIDNYVTSLENQNDMLSAVIFGVNFHNSILSSTYDLFLNYAIKWFDSRTMVIRYEDLISKTPGIIETKTIETVKSILEFIGADIGKFDLKSSIFRGAKPIHSLTYRSGKIGEWKREFNDNNVNQLKILAPKLISLLGYEHDESWDLGSKSLVSNLDIQTAKNLSEISGPEVLERHHSLLKFSNSPQVINMINGWTSKHLVDQEYFLDAIPILDKLLESEPRNPLWNYYMAFCLHRCSKDLQNALKCYDIALQEGFDPFWIYYNRGALYHKLGELEKAYSEAISAEKINPRDKGVKDLLALLNYNKIE